MKTTYNKSQIFKNAWTIVKTTGEKLSAALKMAWAKAKNVMTKTMTINIEQFKTTADSAVVQFLKNSINTSGGDCACIDLNGNILTNDLLDAEFEYSNVNNITLSFVKKSYLLIVNFNGKIYYPAF